MDIREPEIARDEILILNDAAFSRENVCLVTGCGTGIGRAVALVAAANGLTVAGLDINETQGSRTQSMARDLGGTMEFIPTDLTEDDQIRNAVDRAASLGQIKFLANIAGIQHIDALENFPMETYDLMQRLMLRAPFFLSQLVIPHIKASADGCGAIAHMASVHAHICTKNKPAYNITKFGLRALSQSIAAEGEGKIRSFTVSSGFVKTALALNQIEAQAEQRGITPEEVVSQVMMGSSRVKDMMKPVEVANHFIHGFSSYSRYLVGGDILCDGGMVLTYAVDKE
ncbi:MAG: SDR family oxidoreductase [Desulfobacterales bacterium]|nr:SDR family oxidoreductase [Desulfobacterales bacterium]